MKPPTTKKSRSPAEFEETIRSYDRELHAYLVRRLRGRTESADDIRQEIYLRILRFTDAELVREPRAYLFSVARNVLYDKHLIGERERKTFVFTENGADVPDGITEDQAGQLDVEHDLNAILSQLPPLYRAILVLRTSGGMSHREIAQELKVSEHTVKKYMHEALVQCRSIASDLM